MGEMTTYIIMQALRARSRSHRRCISTLRITVSQLIVPDWQECQLSRSVDVGRLANTHTLGLRTNASLEQNPSQMTVFIQRIIGPEEIVIRGRWKDAVQAVLRVERIELRGVLREREKVSKVGFRVYAQLSGGEQTIQGPEWMVQRRYCLRNDGTGPRSKHDTEEVAIGYCGFYDVHHLENVPAKVQLREHAGRREM